MRPFLFFLMVLGLSTPAVAEFDHSLHNLPAPWEGGCYVATHARNRWLFMVGQPLQTIHNCAIVLDGRFAMILERDAMSTSRVYTRTFRHLYASNSAPLSLRFPDGLTLTIPPVVAIDPWHPTRYARGWIGQEAETIGAHLKQASSIEMRYTPVPYFFRTRQPSEPTLGPQKETYRSPHFAAAYAIVEKTIMALPMLIDDN